MSNYVEQLQEVKKLLTKNTWNKGNYFSVKNDTLCFCPHGAAQAVCNPEVKKVISKYNADCYAAHRIASVAARAARRRAAHACARAARADHAFAVSALCRALRDPSGAILSARDIKDFSDLFDLWNNREGWIKEDYIINNINYGNLDLHYLIGITGLTINFADHPNTTLEMIYDKLDEAIEMAKIIDQYNNKTVNKEIYLLLKSNNLLAQGSKELQEWAKSFEDQEKEDLKKKALAKLTPEEIKALGINT